MIAFRKEAVVPAVFCISRYQVSQYDDVAQTKVHLIVSHRKPIRGETRSHNEAIFELKWTVV